MNWKLDIPIDHCLFFGQFKTTLGNTLKTFSTRIFFTRITPPPFPQYPANVRPHSSNSFESSRENATPSRRTTLSAYN